MSPNHREKVLEVSTPAEGEKSGDAPAGEEAAEAQEEARLYGVAMLKVAMELKKPHPPPLEEVINTVLTRMNLSREAFSKYLDANTDILQAMTQRRR